MADSTVASAGSIFFGVSEGARSCVTSPTGTRSLEVVSSAGWAVAPGTVVYVDSSSAIVARHAMPPAWNAFATKGTLLALMMIGCTQAFPQAAGAQDLGELRRQIEVLRVEHERHIAEIRHETEQRLRALEGAIAGMERGLLAAPAGAAGAAPPHALTAQSTSAPESTATAVLPPSTPALALPAAVQGSQHPPAALNVAGDTRLRFESNTGQRRSPNPYRSVLRGRLRANYRISSRLTIGSQLATGDPDDPNSTDVTLSNFYDDLQVSLDQAYVHADFGALQVDAGKFGNPFSRTDLVWDGDVSPQGLAAIYEKSLGADRGATLRLVALYSPVDEQATGPDSNLYGVQAKLGRAFSDRRWEFDFSAGYYDYDLGSLTGGDAGDYRNNLLDAAGRRYQSDFDLLDVIAGATWLGLGEAWPLGLRVDLIRNLGAATSADNGVGVDVTLGRASTTGHWRFGVGYARVETDAVLAAFSHDNTGLGTNYRQHTLSIDYSLGSHSALNATWYRYRQLEATNADVPLPADWVNRIRLNYSITF
jgi:Putative porin